MSRLDAKRRAILAVARDIFLAEGFQGASMSAIAARVGGSKGTLYNHYDSKEALFDACIRDHCGRFADDMLRFDEAKSVADNLRLLGRHFLEKLYEREAIRTFQIVVAEAERTPDLARIFYQAGPAVGIDRLAAWLRRQTAAGRLAVDDPERAAGQFLALCRGHCHLRLVLHQSERPSAAAVGAEADEAVAMFMARYGAARNKP